LSLRPKDNQYDAGLGHWLAKLNQGDDRLRWKVISAMFDGHPREAKYRMIADCNRTLDEKTGALSSINSSVSFCFRKRSVSTSDRSCPLGSGTPGKDSISPRRSKSVSKAEIAAFVSA
jgi:hypothetical protein